MHNYTIAACAPSLRAFGQVWQCKVAKSWKWTEMGLRGFDDVFLLPKAWGLARSSNMSYLTWYNFAGICREYFLCKYFKSLKYPERVSKGFAQYFEHDHVLKLLYMDNICPKSLSEFRQIFLKLLNNFYLLKTISGLKKKPLNKIGK